MHDIPKEPIGEDYLYLNVWTGAETASDKLPGLVYIYGGGFRSGGSGCAIYDGEAMAGKDNRWLLLETVQVRSLVGLPGIKLLMPFQDIQAQHFPLKTCSS